MEPLEIRTDDKLIEWALEVAGLKKGDVVALALILNEPLSWSLEGRRLLNDRDFPMSDVERLRKILKLR